VKDNNLLSIRIISRSKRAFFINAKRHYCGVTHADHAGDSPFQKSFYGWFLCKKESQKSLLFLNLDWLPQFIAVKGAAIR